MRNSPDWGCRSCDCSIPDFSFDLLLSDGVTFDEGEPAYCSDCNPTNTNITEDDE